MKKVPSSPRLGKQVHRWSSASKRTNVARVTLRARLLLTTGVLSLAITLGLSLVVRRAWEQAERQRFDQSFQQAVSELEAELQQQSLGLTDRLTRLCAHDTSLDSALIGLLTGSLKERLLPVSLTLKEQREALLLDELALVDSSGRILAGRVRGKGTRVSEELRAQLATQLKGSVIQETPSPSLEAFCTKHEQGRWLGLVATKSLTRLLEDAAQHHQLSLTLQPVGRAIAPEESTWSETIRLKDAEGLLLVARRSHVDLSRSLAEVDLAVVSAAAAILALALGIALLLSRGLAKPIVSFAQRTREAIGGEAKPLPIEGGPELEQAARAFNQTLADLKRLQQRLQVTERIAARRDLARKVAHEIKNPLSPIRTSVETLQRLRANQNPAFEQVVDEALATVLSEVRRMTRLVDNFATYGKMAEPKLEPVELVALVAQTMQLHRGLGPELHLHPPEPAELLILADRDQLTAALTNLLKNAIEALAGQNDARIDVRISLDSPPRFVSVIVADNGPGVPEDLRASLMEPYRTTKAHGTGLGLALTHRIAVEHGGDLTYACSDTGGTSSGAAFTLSLPLQEPPALR